MAWFRLRPKRSRSRSSSPRTPGARTGNPRQTLGERIIEALTNYGRLGRVGLAVLTVAALLLVTRSWNVPFPFRVSDYSAHGVTSRLSFDRLDEEETRREQERAAVRAPQVFRNDTATLGELPARLRADLGRITAAESLDDLAPQTAAAFGLTGAGSERVSPDSIQRFRDLKAATEPRGQLASDDRIDGLVDDLDKFIDPLYRVGVIDRETVDKRNLGRSAKLRVLPTDAVTLDESVRPGEDVILPQVTLSDQLTDSGVLGSKWLLYPEFTPIRPAIETWLQNQVTPTLRLDPQATSQAEQAARDSVQPVVDTYLKGQVLVAPGTLITDDAIPLLRAEHNAAAADRSAWQKVLRLSLVMSLLAVLAVVNAVHVVRSEPRVAQRLPRLLVYLSTVVGTVVAARWLSYDPWRAEIIPLATVAMVFAIAYNQVLATALALTLCVIVTLATTLNLPQMITLMAVTTASVLMVGRVRSRFTLVRVGLIAAVVHLFSSLAMRVLASQMPVADLLDQGVLLTALLGSLWCILAGYVVSGTLPLVERLFGVVTDISLLELSDPSHELLQDLVRQAPGTYSHSMSVASISESAAESIGANGLLCRVAAYFHDCGKMIKPEYFIENVPTGQESRHKSLSPAMSTLVIIGHVKDGVDLARRHNLPQVLIDFIEQHHGTTLVEYFYRAAQKAAEESDAGETEEADFRYPGPKPQTREAACMMLADCCESACRTLTDPTAKRISALVEKLTMKRLLDGQFDDCQITLDEIETVSRAVSKSLTAMYHGRIKYPEATSEKSKSA